MKLNKNGGTNWIGVVLILVGVIVLVGAVTWNKDALYHANEDFTYTVFS